MATGWARQGAVQEQIDSTVNDGVALARSRLAHVGGGASHCAECGERIPPRRREAVPGARLCVVCQAERDESDTADTGFNRRASKDSQLR